MTSFIIDLHNKCAYIYYKTEVAHYDRNSGSHISGMVAQAYRTGGSLEHRLFSNDGKNKYTEVYCVCKGTCDRKMEALARPYKNITGWNDISDLVIPVQFLKFVLAIMNRIREHKDVYTDEAYEDLKSIIISLAQITMKRQTKHDINRVISLSELPEGL